jgi:hypothetical protein
LAAKQRVPVISSYEDSSELRRRTARFSSESLHIYKGRIRKNVAGVGITVYTTVIGQVHRFVRAL